MKTIEELKAEAALKWPFYTAAHPNPETGKKDCNLDRQFKTAAREAYVNKMWKKQNERV